MIIIDANILVYHLTGVPEDFATRSSSLIRRIISGQERGFVPATAILETIHVLRTAHEVPLREVSSALSEILASPSFESEHRAALMDALAFAAEQGPLSFGDCYVLTLAKHLGIRDVATFDKKLGRYPGVERVEP